MNSRNTHIEGSTGTLWVDHHNKICGAHCPQMEDDKNI